MATDRNWSPAFVCPACHTCLTAEGGGALQCSTCGSDFESKDGIYHLLRPARLAKIKPQLDQYRRVRADDGYTRRNPAQHRMLPAVERGDPHSARWRIRRQSFRSLCSHVLPTGLGRSALTILDLGAGNGWLSHRLAALGHTCVAVDLLDDAEDGLGVFRVYPSAFTCVQADFDELPFAPGQFDVVVFNASLHYSPDVVRTLAGARHQLVDGGTLVVMDSPTFNGDDDGRRMIAAQQAEFRARCGTALQWGTGFLTQPGLEAAGRAVGITFHAIRSRGTPAWELRRLLAGLKEQREPARFGVWFGVWRAGLRGGESRPLAT